MRPNDANRSAYSKAHSLEVNSKKMKTNQIGLPQGNDMDTLRKLLSD
jgi:hypothetical protein